MLKATDKFKEELNDNSKKAYPIKNVVFNSSTSLALDNFNLKKEDKPFFKRLIPQELKFDINKIQKWRYKAQEITINNDIWFSENLFLTNDPFNKPQLVIKNSKFNTSNQNEEILIKSKWSTLILDDLVKIPIGPRRIKIGEENNFRWGFGYDNNKKDGFFITRNFDPFFSSSENTTLKVKRNFMLKGLLKVIQKVLVQKMNQYYLKK